jgi:hypothetical protein
VHLTWKGTSRNELLPLEKNKASDTAGQNEMLTMTMLFLLALKSVVKDDRITQRVLDVNTELESD